MPSKLNCNKSARDVAHKLRDLGCLVLTKGWPDILALYGRSLFAVEVKFGDDKPTADQDRMAEALWRFGLPTWEVHDVPNIALFDRMRSDQLNNYDKTKIIMVDTLYEAIRSRGEQSLPDHIFRTQTQFVAGHCSQCGMNIFVEKEKLRI